MHSECMGKLYGVLYGCCWVQQVQVLVKESTLNQFSIDVVDTRHEDILWIA